MDQRLSLITLGVTNLKKMRDFYTNQFGWQPMQETGDIVFFKLNGILLALFPTDELAADAGVPSDGSGFRGITLAHNLNSEEAVDQLFEKLSARGVKVVKRPEKVFWGGYSGYVADPENNLWEIAYNPFLELDTNGNIVGAKG